MAMQRITADCSTTTIPAMINDMNAKGITFGGKPYGQSTMTHAEFIADASRRSGVDYSKPGTRTINDLKRDAAKYGVSYDKGMSQSDFVNQARMKAYGTTTPPKTMTSKEFEKKFYADTGYKPCKTCKH